MWFPPRHCNLAWHFSLARHFPLAFSLGDIAQGTRLIRSDASAQGLDDVDDDDDGEKRPRVTLLDPSRARNVEIVLRSIKVDIKRLVDCIIRVEADPAGASLAKTSCAHGRVRGDVRAPTWESGAAQACLMLESRLFRPTVGSPWLILLLNVLVVVVLVDFIPELPHSPRPGWSPSHDRPHAFAHALSHALSLSS